MTKSMEILAEGSDELLGCLRYAGSGMVRLGSGLEDRQALRQAGYRPIARPRGFYVTGHPVEPTTDGTLRKGEEGQARLWGAELAKAMKKGN